MKQSLTDEDFIANVKRDVKDIEAKHPDFMRFLEFYCGYNTPVMSAEPHVIAYAGGKRDVILTLKTIEREDLSPEMITKFFKGIR